MRNWLYILLTTLYRAFCFVCHPIRVKGIENIPAEGPVIICANHQSAQDPFVLASYTKRGIRFMAKKELFRIFLVKSVCRKVGAFPVARGENDISAVRTSLQLLKNGEILGIFPEGHRYHDGEMHEAFNGVSLIALRSKAAVVPVYIGGNYALFRAMSLTIGKKVDLSEFGGKMDADTLEKTTEKIRGAIRRLADEPK
ncbi:MAG: 1-acyl-sn-glycerol-3-phosphate acyltransferase [Clostridia bacterium]|nr:1-acyl-sn-glycerol-3-phosphate acyltransferase [Clostridia bacterium]